MSTSNAIDISEHEGYKFRSPKRIRRRGPLWAAEEVRIFNGFRRMTLAARESVIEGMPLLAGTEARPSPVPALELTGVARRFGRRWALRGITLRIEPGEAVAVVGANGSGKTTLLRIVATSLRPTRGGGRIYGRDLLQEPDAVRPLVGLLGHAAGVYDDLTAAENLAFGLSMAGAAPAGDRVAEALERVGLSEVAEERVRGFSTGMRRRLGLARLLLRPPRLLLLDEPYASFDADGVARLNDFMRALTADGGAALVATHDLDRGSGVLDRVVGLDQGVVTHDGAFGEGAGSGPGRGRDFPAGPSVAAMRPARRGGGL